MYKDTITLFNRVRGDREHGDTWYPTVLTGVNLNTDRAAILAKYGSESSDKCQLHIKFFFCDGERIVKGLDTMKRYVSPKEFTDPDSEITFASGNQFDFFWEGIWDGGVVSDSDYQKNLGFYNYMNDAHDNVFAVSSAAVYSVIPHFEIMGK